jgi:hypothetical protein
MNKKEYCLNIETLEENIQSPQYCGFLSKMVHDGYLASQTFPTFTQPRGILLFTEKLTTGTCSELDESTLHP